MILSGPAIKNAYEKGEIIINPFDELDLNPNSYNYRLYKTILRVSQDEAGNQQFERIDIPDTGYVLQPDTLYLGATLEVLGSTKFVMTLLGRSSLGRLGLFLNSTADLGHVGSISQWTLELSVVQPLKLYPGMRIGQLSFWKQVGDGETYTGRYHKDIGPVPNRDILLHLQLKYQKSER